MIQYLIEGLFGFGGAAIIVWIWCNWGSVDNVENQRIYDLNEQLKEEDKHLDEY
jgi:hypothetical protein